MALASRKSHMQCRGTFARAATTRPPRTMMVCKASRSSSEASLQLATAKLPTSVSVPDFNKAMYQWAATLTQSGANYPFVYPLQTDRLPTGFKISLLKSVSKGTFDTAADLEATVEDVAGAGNVLFVRFYGGPASNTASLQKGSGEKQLETLLDGLIDVPTIMQTMPRAIRKAVQLSSDA